MMMTGNGAARVGRSVCLGLLGMMLACAHQSPGVVKSGATDPTAERGSVLSFSERAGTEADAGTVRMLVSGQFLRIDEGPDSQDFVLYDRKQDKAWNVVAEDRSVLLIHAPQTTGAVIKPDWQIETEASHALGLAGLPNGTRSSYVRLSLAGQTCLHQVTADLFPRELELWREYQLLLSRYSRQAADGGLSDQIVEADACRTAIKQLDPATPLSGGFPLREWNDAGYQRFLMDFRNGVVLDPVLFTIPAEYLLYQR